MSAGRFDGFHSAEEAEYPSQFCTKVAELTWPELCRKATLPRAVVAGSVVPVDAACAAARAPPSRVSAETRAARAAAGTQARGCPAGLVREHKDIQVVPYTIAEEEKLCGMVGDRCGALLTLQHGNIPKDARILSVNPSNARGLVGTGLVQVGIPWSPSEFLLYARQLKHPFDAQSAASDGVKRAIFHLLTEGPDRCAEWRRSQLQKWRT